MLMRVSGPVANAVIERQHLPPRRPPPVRRPPATPESARHREGGLLEPCAGGPSGSGCGRERGSNIKKGAWCQVPGVRNHTSDTRHQTPCLTETRRIASKFEQTFETSC